MKFRVGWGGRIVVDCFMFADLGPSRPTSDILLAGAPQPLGRLAEGLRYTLDSLSNIQQ